MSYGIWHYVHLTDDKAFLYRYGAEMLLQIARFQATRVGFSEKIGKYGFFGVMGPDEFHMMVNNNAYTNYMGMRAPALRGGCAGCNAGGCAGGLCGTVRKSPACT